MNLFLCTNIIICDIRWSAIPGAVDAAAAAHAPLRPRHASPRLARATPGNSFIIFSVIYMYMSTPLN